MKKLNKEQQKKVVGGASGYCKVCGRKESWGNTPKWLMSFFHTIDFGHGFQ